MSDLRASLHRHLRDAHVVVRQTGDGRHFVPLTDAGGRARDKKDIFGPKRKQVQARLYLDTGSGGVSVTAAGRVRRFGKVRPAVAFVRRYLTQPVFLMSSAPGAWAYKIDDRPTVTGRVPGVSEADALVHGVRHVLQYATARHFAFGIATHGAIATGAPRGGYALQDGLHRLPVWRKNDFRCGLTRRIPQVDVWRDISEILRKAHEHQIYFMWVRGCSASGAEKRLGALKAEAAAVGDAPKWNRTVSLNRYVPFYSLLSARDAREKLDRKRAKMAPLPDFEWDRCEEDDDED